MLARLINVIALEKNRDPNWPSGKFTEVYKKTKDLYAPDNVVAKMEIDDDLQILSCEETKTPRKS